MRIQGHRSFWRVSIPTLVCLTSAWCFGLSSAASVLAQHKAKGRTAFESIRGGIKVQLSGFLETQPRGPHLAYAKLNIGIYRTSYRFEVVTLEAVDQPHISSRAILGLGRERELTFDLIGPRALLHKIAQSPPGTPLRIIGILQPRYRKITVTQVTVLGFG